MIRNRTVPSVLAALVVSLFASGASAQVLCDNSCTTAFDNECDDGGTNSMYSTCTLGSDCSDCGPRTTGDAFPVPTPGALCTNTCSTANDNECDDGGPNSMYAICALGSDCNDCGPRGAEALPPAGSEICQNSCSTAFDNECDDGGPGSMYSICALGSDCNDCGPRIVGTIEQIAPIVAGGVCSNTCGSANDNECDDGGPNSLYNVCRYGTDCGDCGPRPPTGGCSNSCATANDNECDDGGPGSIYSICALGTDCGDCGPR